MRAAVDAGLNVSGEWRGTLLSGVRVVRYTAVSGV
jgi:hypothetical protein